MRLPRLVGRAGWNLADQAILSLTNLGLSLLVARSVDSTAFGAFSLAFSVYSITIVVARNLGSQPVIIRFPDAEPAAAREAAAQSTGASGAIGLAVGAVSVVIGLLVGGIVGQSLLALGLVLPGVLVQDACRLVAVARRNPRAAVLLDVVWGVLQLGAVFLLVATSANSVALFIIAWGAAAAVSALVGTRRLTVRPRVTRALTWIRAHWDLTGFMLFEGLLLQGAYQAVLLFVGASGELDTVGALRAAQVVNGPIALVSASAFTFAVPELVNRAGLRDRRPVLLAALIGSSLALVTACWNGLVLLVPDDVGQRVLGDSWEGMSAVLLFFAIGQVGNVLATGPAVVAYAMGETRATFRIHCVVAAMLVLCGVVGHQVGGAQGTALGFAIAYWSVLPLWFLKMRAFQRDRASGAVPVGEPSAG